MMFRFVFLLAFLFHFGVGTGQEIMVQVISQEGGIPNARLETAEEKLVSDLEGKFVLPLAKFAGKSAKIWAIGYEEKQIVLPDSAGVVEIEISSVSVFFSEVVVTGSKEEESKKESIVRISTINQTQLQSVGAQSISEGISFQPGLRMENNCQNCGFSQLRMNGLGGGYNQFLMNGRPVFSSLNSIYGLEQIPVSWVERVEVIRGGGSVLYGANAIAGIVNIITRDPINSGASGQVSVGYMDGSWDQYAGGTGAWVAKNNKAGVSVSAGQRYRENYDRDKDGFSDIPILKGLALDVNGFYRPGKKSRLGVKFRIMDEFRRGGDQLDRLPEETQIAEQLKSKVYGGELSYEAYLKNDAHKMEAFFATQHTIMNNYYGAEMDPDGYGKTRDENYVSGFRHRWKSKRIESDSKGIAVVSGAEMIRNVMSDNKPGYGVHVFQPINQFGVYTQLDWLLSPKFKLNAGARVNYDNVLFKPLVTPRLGMKYSPFKFAEIRLNYANGYRIPQVFSEDVHVELVSGEIQLIRLGDDLKHELSHGLNLDISFDFEKGKSDIEIVLNGFYNQLQNVFVLEFTQDALGQNILEKRNGQRAEVAGGSFEFNYSWKDQLFTMFTFSAQSTRYSEPVEWAEGQYVSGFLRTPDYYGSLVVSYAINKKIDVNSSAILTGPMYLPHYAGYIAEDKLERSETMVDWGFKINYNFYLKNNVKLTLNGGVKNILDTFQRDLDKGVHRDASYTYGPVRARTFFIGIQIGNL